MKDIFKIAFGVSPAIFIAILAFSWIPFKFEIFTEYPLLCDPYSNPHYGRIINPKKKAKARTKPTKSPPKPKKIAKKTTKPKKK